ncbi:hypothetical protein GCM10023169_18550 [Georgenia halophila]|uniref:Uncharacterized protein n=1 Tax=Georgenia halophila TaxID=620889 RepID=A0ABP8L695_9MICO
MAIAIGMGIGVCVGVGSRNRLRRAGLGKGIDRQILRVTRRKRVLTRPAQHLQHLDRPRVTRVRLHTQTRQPDPAHHPRLSDPGLEVPLLDQSTLMSARPATHAVLGTTEPAPREHPPYIHTRTLVRTTDIDTVGVHRPLALDPAGRRKHSGPLGAERQRVGKPA